MRALHEWSRRAYMFARQVIFSRLPSSFKRSGVELSAFLTGRSFSCNALSGESAYNICVNSDLSVSCNCWDIDGSGQLGNLHEETFSELFCGGKAQRFRDMLGRGRLPMAVCSSCSELAWVPYAQGERRARSYRAPYKGIMVENNAMCNLSCLACDRGTVLSHRRKARMSLDEMEQVALLVKELGIRVLSFTNLGEPFQSDTILEELRIMRRHNPDITIMCSTNGLLLNSPGKQEAALLLDHLYFSIDGATDESLRRYQRGGSFQKAYDNMAALVKIRNSRGRAWHPPFIEWKYVLFNWNDEKDLIERAVSLAMEAGVDALSFYPTGNPPHGISWRYYFARHFRHLGKDMGNRREVRFITE